METSAVSPEASIKMQKASDKQLEKVTKTIISGIEQSYNQSREFHETGHSLNVTA